MSEMKAPRGTYDILPGDSRKWQYIEDVVSRVFHAYGYEEIRTPIFEHTELFVRGIGETTDIVEKEMYTFEDNGGRSLTLRPEGTAPVARAYIEHKMFSGPLPFKVYYIGPMFRYERPQAGRYRQLFQFGAEAVGTSDPVADVEMISMPIEIYQSLGLKSLAVQLNSIGCPQCRPKYRHVLVDWLKQREDNLCRTCRSRLERNPLRVLDCKVEQCQEATGDAPQTLDYLCEECAEHFSTVQSYLTSLGIPITVEPRLVRGLDYYTKTVFEIVSTAVGAQSALCGGGRYDGLVEEVGGRPTPAVGFAAGIDRLMLALENEGIELPVSMQYDIFVAALGEKARKQAVEVAFALRARGIRTNLDYNSRSLKAQMKAANRDQAKLVLILGEDELQRGVAVVRRMDTSEQTEIGLSELVDHCVALISG